MTVKSKTAPPNWRPLPARNGQSEYPLLYRSAALTLATDDERSTCPTDLIWFDLRTPQELENDPRIDIPPGWTQVNYSLTDPGITMVRGQAEEYLTDLIDGKLTFGQQYVEMLTIEKHRIAVALSRLLELTGPIVIACQGGRDRTGLMSALVLLLAGAPNDVIISDYVATNQTLEADLARQPTGDVDHLMARLDLTCREQDMEVVLDHFESLGGIQGYFAGVLEATEINHLRNAAKALLK